MLEEKTRGSIGRFVHPSLTPVVLLYMVSRRAGHAHASSLLRKGIVSSIDVYIALLASGLSLRIMYMYRLYIPVLIPLLGRLALYIILLRILFDTTVLLAVMAYGRKRYRGEHLQGNSVRPQVKLEPSTVWRGFKEGAREAAGFLLRFTPLYIIVSLMMLTGVMDRISVELAPFLHRLGASSLGATCIATSIASPRVAWGIAKMMVDAGHPANEVLGCLFLGSGLFVLLNELWTKHLPFYASLYPKRVVLGIVVLRSLIPAAYSILLGILLLKL